LERSLLYAMSVTLLIKKAASWNSIKEGIGDDSEVIMGILVRKNKVKIRIEDIATVFFIFFLIMSFFYTRNIPFNNEDIFVYRLSNLHFDYGGGTHALPMLANLFYKIVPVKVIQVVSPFTIVLSYVMIYLLVSKKIKYWYIAGLFIPLWHSTLIPSVIDWILTPILYYKLVNGKDKQGIVLSVIMVFFHGPYALIYIFMVYGLVKKWKQLILVTLLSIPQNFSILYFSRAYAIHIMTSDWMVFWFPYSPVFTLSTLAFRFLYIGMYIVMFSGSVLSDRGTQ
jgi:hypothetical protein